MKKFLKFLFYFLFLIEGTKAQINKTLPTWVNKIEFSQIKAIPANEIKDGYYYVLVDEQHNTIEKHAFYRYVTKITSQTGLNNVSEIEISYDPSYQKAVIHSIRVYRGGAFIDKTGESKILVLDEESERKNNILQGRKTLFCNLSDLRIGDVVDYSYSIKGRNPIYGDYFSYDLWFSFSEPVGKILRRILTKPGELITVAKRNTNIEAKVKEGKVTEYLWEIEQPRIQLNLKNIPSWYEPNQIIEFSNFSNWEQVKTTCRKLLAADKYSKAGLLLISDSIRKRFPNEKEKQIRSAVDFAQNELRYSGNSGGIYSHKPHAPDWVLKHRYGDCKDKSIFLIELLKSLEVTAYPVLLNTELNGQIAAHAPSLSRFDHCIVAISEDQNQYFIDPTISFQMGSAYKRMVYPYKQVFVLDDGPAEFKTPETDSVSKVDVLEEFEINEEGDASLKATFTYRGLRADETRMYFASNSLNDIQENYTSVYKKYDEEIFVLDSVRYEDDSEANVFTTFESYTLKNFWKPEKGGENDLIQKSFIPYFINDKMVYVSEKSRNQPLEINYPVNIQNRIRVKSAIGWKTAPEQFSEKNNFFDYSFNCRTSNDVLILDYSYVAKKSVVDTGEYANYKSKMDLIDNNILYSVQQKLTKTEVNSFNWLLLLVDLIAIIVSLVLCLYFFKQKMPNPYENRYDTISGWLYLVALGVVLNPLLLVFSFIGDLDTCYSINYYTYYLDKSSQYYAPAKAYIVLGESFLNIFLIIMSYFMLPLFFKRRSSFRYYYCFFRIFNLLFIFADYILLKIYFEEFENDTKLVTETQNDLIKLFIQTAIWVPYMWFSERSRHTFTTVYGDDTAPKISAQSEQVVTNTEILNSGDNKNLESNN